MITIYKLSSLDDFKHIIKKLYDNNYKHKYETEYKNHEDFIKFSYSVSDISDFFMYLIYDNNQYKEHVDYMYIHADDISKLFVVMSKRINL